MQVFGVRENFTFDEKQPKAKTPLASRVFTKLESSLWDSGHATLPLLPDLTGEIEIVARVDHPVETPLTPEEAAKLKISYTLGIDFGSGERGEQDGQWWRSKGARGYAPIARFTPGRGGKIQDLRHHKVDLSVKGRDHTKTILPLSGIQNSVPEIVSLLSEHCNLAAGDLIFLGALHFIQDFTAPMDIIATCADLEPLQIKSVPDSTDRIRLIMVEDKV